MTKKGNFLFQASFKWPKKEKFLIQVTEKREILDSRELQVAYKGSFERLRREIFISSESKKGNFGLSELRVA